LTNLPKDGHDHNAKIIKMYFDPIIKLF